VCRYANSARVFRYAKSASLRFSDVEGDGFKVFKDHIMVFKVFKVFQGRVCRYIEEKC